MISYRPELNVDYGRVIQFRPRIGMSRRGPPGNAAIENAEPDYSPVPDLAKYECPESDDDEFEYRHRMTVNAIAAAFTSVLILAGVWIANMMAHA
jgi:hypothetical protein